MYTLFSYSYVVDSRVCLPVEIQYTFPITHSSNQHDTQTII